MHSTTALDPLNIPGLAKRHVWAIGGQVRDALLFREVTADRDYVVVGGDAKKYAHTLAEYWSTGFVGYSSVRTYTVNLQDKFGYTVDFATSRAERYPKPGKFPEIVRFGVPINWDLRRRDFTVNAIAQNVSTGEFRVSDHAWDDLRNRQLRPLHSRSFIDDPIRMLRMVRYAVDLDFSIHPNALTMVDNNLIKIAGKARVEKEISRWTTKHWLFAEEIGLYNILYPEYLDTPECVR